MSMHRWLIGVGLGILVAGCGSATDATSFHAPPGYTTALSVGPFGQVWRGPRGERSAIVLMALPTEIPFNKITESSNIKDAQILKSEEVKICGAQDAYHVAMIGEATETETETQTSSAGSVSTGSSTPTKQEIDLIATHLNGKTYMAMYARRQGAAADTAAESAIRGICPKS